MEVLPPILRFREREFHDSWTMRNVMMSKTRASSISSSSGAVSGGAHSPAMSLKNFSHCSSLIANRV